MSDPTKYTVGWICALSTEFVAALEVLDEEHEDPGYVADRDNNAYALGEIGKHNVVIACLPDGQYGTSSAAAVARDMLHSFPNVRIGLMVGIGGGAPRKRHDIRLGDVVVSSPGNGRGGIFQYDFGKILQGQPFQQTGHLNQPPTLLSSAVTKLKVDHEIDGNEIHDAVTTILTGRKRLQRKYGRPDPHLDQLYQSDHLHIDPNEDCSACGDDPMQLVHREDREEEYDDVVAIHYGLIASANSLMKDAGMRDQLANKEGVLCFEMEAAGLMNHFPCLVVRGICDYSDSHKNKKWQGYAAMAASVYARQLILGIPPTKLEMETRIIDFLDTFQETVERTESCKIHVQNVLQNNDLDQWLHSPDSSVNFNHALQQREPNTGLWFLNGESFAKWKVESKSFLWLHGIPGCGKTVLSATIIDDLKRHLPNHDSILYFYCDFNDTAKQTLENILRSLIHQLYYQHSDTQPFLNNLFSSHRREQPSHEELCIVFIQMIQCISEVWIIIDAVDECITRKGPWTEGILAWLDHMQRQEQGNIHLLITSRPEQDISARFSHLADEGKVITLQSNVVDNDIHAYVQRRIREDENLKRWRRRPEKQKEIERTLMKKANGMFRWAVCQLDALENCLDPPSLHNALQSLPKTLDGTYDRILQNIPEEHHESATRILQLLAFSERPLRVIEIADALAVDLNHKPYFNPENRMPDPCEMSRYCSSLVVIVSWDASRIPEDDILKNHADGNKVLQLAHFSVKEYLTSSRATVRSHTAFDEATSRRSIASTSVAYLLCIDSIMAKSDILNKFPFARYAATYWIYDATVPREKKDELYELIMELFRGNKISYRNWHQLYNPEGNESEGSNLVSPLYYASLVGLRWESEQLALSGADVNAEGGYLGSALQAASQRGHQHIVEILLKHGADVNAEEGYLGSALQAASFSGHKEIVEMLLNHGANVDAEGGYFSSVLQAASYSGHRLIVKILLQHGADANVTRGRYGHPLRAASVKGNKEVVEMLLSHGADVNLAHGTPRDVWTSLHEASHNGHTEIGKLLLEKGARVDSMDEKGLTPLHLAVKSGHTQMVKVLLENNADITIAVLENGWTPLHEASFHGRIEIAILLLEKGAGIDLLDQLGRTPLHLAFEGGKIEMANLLLERGADIELAYDP